MRFFKISLKNRFYNLDKLDYKVSLLDTSNKLNKYTYVVRKALRI